MSCLVILAAGEGSRFGGPKQFVEFGALKRTLLEYNICHAIEAGFSSVVIITQPKYKPLLETRILPRLPTSLNVEIAEQNSTHLPLNIHPKFIPDKPLGTAHALWSAKAYLSNDFSVINGDDYYAKNAFQQLTESSNSAHGSLIGYPLASTLSNFGGVNRGICNSSYSATNQTHYLTSIKECLNIQKRNEFIEGYYETNSTNESKKKVRLKGSEIISMNCWRFKLDFLEIIEKSIVRHFSKTGYKSECYLPEVVMKAISQDNFKFDIKKTDGQWFGLTFPDDKANVENEISRLTTKGAFKILEANVD